MVPSMRILDQKKALQKVCAGQGATKLGQPSNAGSTPSQQGLRVSPTHVPTLSLGPMGHGKRGLQAPLGVQFIQTQRTK